MRGRGAVVGTVVLAAVLAGLAVVGLVGLSGMSDRTRAVETSVRALSAYQDVQRAMAAEAFAEAGYRRAPRAASRVRVEWAIADLGKSVGTVRDLDSRRDDGVVNYLLVLNSRYENEVLAALREGELVPATAPDDRVAGPALDAMQGLVDAAVTRRSRQAEEALSEQRALTGQLWLLGPSVLGVAVLAIGLCWAVILGQHRRLHGRAAASEHRAQHDVLTGVGNRALLSEQLALVFAERQPDAALLMIDLDHFKAVNDDHGHGAGDEVLRTVAARLLQVAGARDVVARMGGDEFAVLVRPASAMSARSDAITQLLRELVRYHGVELSIGGSVGAVTIRPAMDERAVLTEADAALYVAKRAGRLVAPGTSEPLRAVRSPRGA